MYKAFDHGNAECKQAIVEGILRKPGAIVHMGCDRWGSGMVTRLLNALRIRGDPLCAVAMQQLSTNVQVLRKFKHGRKVIDWTCAFMNSSDRATTFRDSYEI